MIAMPELTGQETISQQLEQSCSQEPIHIIGTIQPHGFVLVVCIDSTRIVQVSSGVASHWPGLGPASGLLHRKVEDWVDGFSPDVATVLAALPLSDPAALPLKPKIDPQQPSVEARDGPPTLFECVGHRVGGVAVLEWQPLPDDAHALAGDARFMEGITSALAGLRRAQTLEAFFADSVREVARLSGFDRVMLYRFLPDWTGEVIAEAARPNLTTRFLGLRFPATDIPSQARALYTASKIRVLADVQAVPDTLLPPRLPDGEPLDQGNSVLRGFSNVHRTYLANMGVRATMSLSIVYDGKLWGLIACHHYRPKIPPYHVRNALRNLCELVAAVVAMRIQALAQLELANTTTSMDRLLTRVQLAVHQNPDMRAVLGSLLPDLLKGFQASALCVRVADLNYVGGQTDSSAAESDVLDEVATRGWGHSMATDTIILTNLLTPEGRRLNCLPEAAGILAVKQSAGALELCALTRAEVVQEVSWAGAPIKRATASPDGSVRLEPRRSFDLWKETVAGTARDWSVPEVDACKRLLNILSEVSAGHRRRADERDTRHQVQLENMAGLQRVNLDLEHEVGERVRAEDELRGAYAMLEGRVAERTSELEALNRTLVQDSARSAIEADAAGLGFWNFDIAAGNMQWDERMFRLYGLSPQEGDTHALWIRSLHPDDRMACERDLFDAVNGNRDYDTEFRIVHPNGAIRHLKATGRVTRGAAGDPLRMFGVNFDITERKRADEQFRLAIEAAPTGMLLTDLTGSIVLVNAQIEKLFGYRRRELLGMPVELLVPQRLRASHPDLRRKFNAAPQVRAMGAGAELTGVRRDGSEVPLEVSLNPLQTSKGEFVLCSVVDLTQRREIERMRSDFVSTVSHELRTPLTSIGASLGLILSGAMGMLPEDAAAMVRIANNNSDRLMRIINDILDIGGLESGGFTLQTTNSSAAELIEQAIEANAAFAREFAVRFRFEGTPADDRILVDPDRFIQVITNLLSNAAKFSPSGAEVLIRIRTDAAVIRIEVEDFGPGVPESFQGRIFERFAQADASPSRRFSGTGLGLSIARKLVEAMGGTIGFHSVAGKGSVFHVELPRAAPAPSGRPDHPPAATAAAHAAPRILCVEDDHDFVSLIRETLGERATIVGAHTLEEAEVSLRGGDFALVVLDQSLPDGTGLSLIDLIPEVLGASVPIVILSATEVPHALQHKVAAVLIKSRIPAAQIATTILSYLPLPAD